MKSEFRDICYKSDDDFELIAKWKNDPSLKHLIGFFPNEDSWNSISTTEKVKSIIVSEESSKNIMILFEQRVVGHLSYKIDPRLEGEKPMCTYPNSAWISIVIGDEQVRGKGLGQVSMRFLESKAKEVGADYIELGVFEFNKPAISFYKKLGYQQVVCKPDFTYWNGRMWDGLRFLKKL